MTNLDESLSSILSLEPWNKSLGKFSDSAYFRDESKIEGYSNQELRKFLTDMLLIRFSEESIADLVVDSSAKCPCHLGIGQEGVAVGVTSALRTTDRVYGAHRSHGHYLAMGGDLDELFAEVLGKDTGCSKGMGGSMHIYAPRVGFHGSVPIVGATIPIAVGAGLAIKLEGSSDISVSYFGDGATEEGVFHESMNLAAIKKLPVLFVCENNLYSSHLDIKLRQPIDMCARYGVAHGMRSIVVDGNDVTAVSKVTKELVDGIRNGTGPVFIEAVTYRWRGHVGPREDIDVGVRRKPGDLEGWKERDPIKRLVLSMLKHDIISETEYSDLQQELREAVQKAVSNARLAPYPDESTLLSRVFLGGSNI